ncbi:hypothetical protein J2T12_003594 [Paenibacillus anaericanus]|uniref:phage tail terminator family protein n=1 Tax=Paenibacillus anaericanus TaxID=170367 RepID=UPI00277F5B0E|nr:hypothetical protein [Paenibacillus anaericanus]MDQ0090180.1 hypothetical protein [Paenibacillus anaericanus]
MTEVTIKSLIEGVILSLSSRFPDVGVRSSEGDSKTVAPPYFVVSLAAMSQEQELNRRYNRTYSFNIQYTPASDHPAGIIFEYAEHLYELFSKIEIDGASYFGSGMKHDMKDGGLNFSFEFRFLVWLPALDETKMQLLKEEGRLKYDI